LTKFRISTILYTLMNNYSQYYMCPRKKKKQGTGRKVPAIKRLRKQGKA